MNWQIRGYKYLKEMTDEEREQEFPNLKNDNFTIESPPLRKYNCIAWALGIVTERWWPLKGYRWPKGEEFLLDDETPENFIKAFSLYHYEECENGNFEIGYEKVAIYVKDGAVTHMARQLEDGKWTSKLGFLEDIIHDTCEGVECPDYGVAIRYIKRERLQ